VQRSVGLVVAQVHGAVRLFGRPKYRQHGGLKVSSWYRRSQARPLSYADMRPFVQALVDAQPDRLGWGTNWPHSALFSTGLPPDDARLIDLFCEWVPNANVREQILMTNPGRLYEFEGYEIAIPKRTAVASGGRNAEASSATLVCTSGTGRETRRHIRNGRRLKVCVAPMRSVPVIGWDASRSTPRP